MRVLGIIPARKGSKRVPGKNTKLLHGKPLIQYAFDSTSGARRLSKVVVTSDDEAVEEISKRYNHLTFIRRPASLAHDNSLAIEYVHHVLEVLEGASAFDAIAIIQSTTPFVSSHDIDATVDLFEKGNGVSAVSVVKIPQLQHPFKLKVMKGSQLLPFVHDEGNIKPAQELPDVYSRNGGVYVTEMKTILEGKVIGEPCLGYVMPPERSIDINDPIDFEFAEFLANRPTTS